MEAMAVWLKSVLINPLEGDAFLISDMRRRGELSLFTAFEKFKGPGMFLMVLFSSARGVADFAYKTRSFFCSTIFRNTDITHFKEYPKVFQ